MADRLVFLQNTLDGIIRRFEDEFPETRESADVTFSLDALDSELEKTTTRTSLSSGEAEPEVAAGASDIDDDLEIGARPGHISRTNSNLSLSSKALANEEGRIFRAGHKFRLGWMRSEHYNLLSGVEAIGNDPNHARVLEDIIEELNDEELNKKCQEKGVVRVFQEDKQLIFASVQAKDPEYFARFIESQEKAQANVRPHDGQSQHSSESSDDTSTQGPSTPGTAEDVAVID